MTNKCFAHVPMLQSSELRRAQMPNQRRHRQANHGFGEHLNVKSIFFFVYSECPSQVFVHSLHVQGFSFGELHAQRRSWFAQQKENRQLSQQGLRLPSNVRCYSTASPSRQTPISTPRVVGPDRATTDLCSGRATAFPTQAKPCYATSSSPSEVCC